MKHLFMFFAAIAVLSLLVSAAIAQTAQDDLERARQYKAAGDIGRAIKACETAIKRDRGYAEAHYELGLLYRIKDTPSDLKRASDALHEAMRRAPGTVRYMAALAEVSDRRQMFGDSVTLWERVLDAEPNNIQALLGIAKHSMREIEKYQMRIDEPDGPMFYDENFVNYTQQYKTWGMSYKQLWLGKMTQRPPIWWTPVLEKDFRKAEGCLDHILRVDPGNRDALYNLGRLHFNQYTYSPSQVSYESPEEDDLKDGFIRDSAGITEAEQWFRRLVEAHPDDVSGRLMLGAVLFRQKLYEEAEEQFSAALDLMPEDDRRIFENVGYLKEGGLRENSIKADEGDTTRFWTGKDPLHLTPYNERRLAHYARVAEADVAFALPKSGIPGWKTEQGKIFIKYGEPEKSMQYSVYHLTSAHIKGTNGFSAARGSASGAKQASDPNFRSNDFWYYENFAFVFEKPFLHEEKRYKLAPWQGFNFWEIAQDVEKEYPDYYKYEPSGEFIDFWYDYAGFRGEDGQTRIELYLGVPANRLTFNLTEGFYEGRYTAGIFAFDDDWDKVLSNVEDTDMSFGLDAFDPDSEDLSVDQKTFAFEPGEYHLSLEMMDKLSQNAGSYKDTLHVEEYGYDKLQVSDIQLARDIDYKASIGTVTRKNLVISPIPHRRYAVDQPVFIYYEIYNLRGERTDFTVEYTIEPVETGGWDFPDIVARIFLNGLEDYGRSTTFTYRGNTAEEAQFLKLEHRIDRGGAYRLTLTVTDNNTGQSAEKKTLFYIYDDDGK